MVKTWAKRLYMAFIFLLLYLPIIVLVVLSFNKSKARVTWRGFTFQWYANLFDNSRIMDAFTTTLTLAFFDDTGASGWRNLSGMLCRLYFLYDPYSDESQ